jgi:LacI family transcriptional regulator
MATLRDIAQQAEVSTATVSLALSGKGRISDEVRSKIVQIAHEIGYQYRKTPVEDHNCAVMLLPVYNTRGYVWFFLKNIIDHIQSSMTAGGYISLIIPILNDQPVSEIMEIIHKTRANAVFSLHYGNRGLFRALKAQHIPVVVVNNSEYQSEFSSVCVDDFSGSYEATRILIDHGHTRIAYFDYPRPSLPVIFNDRFNGCRSALQDSGSALPEEWHITTPLDAPEELISQIDRLITSRDRPTAFYVHDDFLASRIHHILISKGLRVPEDISLLAPGDTLDYTKPETPNISTMRIQTVLMGKYAVDLMTGSFNEHSDSAAPEPNVLKIKQQFHDRGSIARRTDVPGD